MSRRNISKEWILERAGGISAAPVSTQRLKRSVERRHSLLATTALGLVAGLLTTAPSARADEVIDGGASETVDGTTENYSEDLLVGDSGTGSLTIQNGGVVTNVRGIIGDDNSGNGTVTVTGTSSQWTNSSSLYVGDFGTAELEILDAATVSNTTGYIGFFSTSTGTVTVDAATWNNLYDLRIGYGGNGTLEITSGGEVTSNGGALGYTSGGVGEVTVDDGTWTNDATIRVGLNGQGTLTINADGQVSNDDAVIADNAGSQGDVTVDGGIWTNDGNVYVGDSGTGTLTIENSGSVTDENGYVGYASDGSGTVTVDNATWTNSALVIVGVAGNGTLNIQNGATVSNTYGRLGNTTGSTGTATVDNATWTNSGDLTVGEGGTGTMTVQNGGSVTNANGYIGNASGGVGTATVTGSGSSWASSTDIYVGNEGTGTLNVLSSGEVSNTDGYIGYEDGSTGTVAVDDATWTNSDDLFVGYNGTGGLTIQNGGTVTNVDGFVGNFYDTSGTVTVTGSGSQWTNSGILRVGQYGSGTLTIEDSAVVSNTNGYIGNNTHSSGTVTVDDATWTNSSSLYVGGYGTGTLIVQNGGSVTNVTAYIGNGIGTGVGTATVTGSGSSWTSSGALNVGRSGEGTLNVLAGATVSNTTGYIGANANSTGTATVDNATWTNTAGLEVGYEGTGTLTIQNAGTVNYVDGNIGTEATGTGTVTVTGSGSSLTGSGDLNVGDSGTGTLSILSGAEAENAIALVGNEAGSTGTVTVDDATWTNSSFLYAGYNGTGTVTLQNGATASATSTGIGFGTGSNGTFTIDDSSYTSGALTAGYSGAGTMTIRNGGTVSATTVNLGYETDGVGTIVVSGSSSTLSSSSTFFVGRSGTGTLTITDGGTVSPDTGTLILAFNSGSTGTLNIGAAAGDTAAAAGTLSATSVDFRDGDGTIVFNHTDTDYEFDALISGDGDVEVYSGETVLTAANTYTGDTLVYGGLLTVDGSILNSSVILTGGSVGGSGTVGSLTVSSGGTLAPGNSVGTLSVTTTTFNSGSTYEVELNDGGYTAGVNNDLLSASGTVTINGGTVNVTPENGTDDGSSYTLGTYTIVTATGGITGSFSDVTDDYAFLAFVLSYDANNVYLTSTVTDFCLEGSSSNECATGMAVESMGSGELFTAVASLSNAEAPAALDLLSGEVHASVKTALLQDSPYVREALNTRLRQAFAQFTNNGPVTVATHGSGPGGGPQGDAVLWVKGFGAFGSTAGDGNAAGFDKYSGGLLAGGDTTIADTWIVGLMTGYSQSYLAVSDRDSSARVNTFHAGAYGGSAFGDLALRFGGELAWHNIDTSRSVSFTGYSDSLSAGYSAQTAQLFAEASYGFRFEDVLLSPFANMAYAHLHTNGFTETGGSAALTSASGDTDNAFQTLGLRLEQAIAFNNSRITLGATVGWQHLYGSDTPDAQLAFSGGSTFTTEGVPLSRDALLLEAGAEMALSPRMSLGGAYSGQLSSGAQNHLLSADFGLRF